MVFVDFGMVVVVWCGVVVCGEWWSDGWWMGL